MLSRQRQALLRSSQSRKEDRHANWQPWYPCDISCGVWEHRESELQMQRPLPHKELSPEIQKTLPWIGLETRETLAPSSLGTGAWAGQNQSHTDPDLSTKGADNLQTEGVELRGWGAFRAKGRLGSSQEWGVSKATHGQSQRTIYCVTPVTWNVWNRQILRYKVD